MSDPVANSIRILCKCLAAPTISLVKWPHNSLYSSMWPCFQNKRKLYCVWYSTFLTFKIIYFRFAINVASFACAGLTPEKLQKWFWAVVFALELRGMTVLASVCDGSGTNRRFQDLLLGKDKK